MKKKEIMSAEEKQKQEAENKRQAELKKEKEERIKAAKRHKKQTIAASIQKEKDLEDAVLEGFVPFIKNPSTAYDLYKAIKAGDIPYVKIIIG